MDLRDREAYEDPEDRLIGVRELAEEHIGRSAFARALARKEIIQRARAQEGVYNCVDVRARLQNNPGFVIEQYADGRAHLRIGFNAPARAECRGAQATALVKVPVDEELRGWLKSAHAEGTTGSELRG
jgi:hypothetical protein